MLCAMTASAPLILVRDLREVVRAGHGNATASVRTLDGVTLAIHSGELVLVDSVVAGGAQALCSALAAPRRGLTGAREVQAGVRIRRGAISHTTRDVIVSTWADAHASRLQTDASGAARVVYLLRVRPARIGEDDATPRDAWRDWARALRASHGALVLFSTAPQSVLSRQRVFGAVHEPNHSIPRGRVRALRLSAGRVVWEQVISAGHPNSGHQKPGPPSPALPYGESAASPLPNASFRCSTGSTAPSSRGDGELR